MASLYYSNPTRIFPLITLVCLAIFSSGCFGDLSAPQRPVNPPTPVLVKMNSPTAGARPEAAASANTSFPTAVQNTPLPPTPVTTPTKTIGELVDDISISDLRVAFFPVDNPGQEKPCNFSPDNFYTCAVDSRLSQSVRVSFVLKPRADLSSADLERLYTSMEGVVYPYRMISRYTPAPPLVDEGIHEVGDGVWGTDFRINSPYRVFSFYLMAEGRSLAGANLYLVPPETQLAAPLPVRSTKTERLVCVPGLRILTRKKPGLISPNRPGCWSRDASIEIRLNRARTPAGGVI